MTTATRQILALLILSMTFWGCGGSKDLLKEIPTTINVVKPGQQYKKKVAAVLSHSPATAIGRATGDLFFKILVDEIRNENDRMILMAPGDAGYPAFMALLPKLPPSSVDKAEFAAAGRQAGYQGLVVAALKNIRGAAKRTGILWFRKNRYSIHFDVTVDLYDPCTAAKVVSEVVEASTKISEDDYEAFQRGEATSIENLNDELEDVAEDLGELVGAALKAQQWKTTVTKVQQGRLYIPAGRQVGLQNGDRLTVFEGRRELETKQGEKFITPGFKLGEVQIVAVDELTAQAEMQHPEKVKAGDILVLTK